jgi:putative flippase GtrA
VVSPHYLVAQVVATGVVLVAGFLANRRWTF